MIAWLDATVLLAFQIGPRTFRLDDVRFGTARDYWPTLPVAVVVVVQDDRLPAEHMIEWVRSRDDLLAYAPVLVVNANATCPACAADQVLTSPPDPALLDAWTIEPNVAVPRLVEHFGQGSIVPLLNRFRESLLALRGNFADGEAHQVAGLAGTLGYTALGTACEALQDDPAMLATVLREVRKAIYDVSQHVETYAAP